MPALLTTNYRATVSWLGRVGQDVDSILSQSCLAIELGFDGVKGDSHSGLTRPSCSRVLSQHPRGTDIRNTRQISAVSLRDLDHIAREIGVPMIDPAWLGATMVLDGVPDLSHLPPSARLQAPDGTTLVVDMENRPCVLPGREIEKCHPGHGKAFKAAAVGRRGVTLWVERPGKIHLNDSLVLHIPDQPVWAHLDRARG